MTPDLGQGGCQAIEDAVTLVALLDNGPDVAAALARYDHLRRARTQPPAARARRLGRLGQLRSRSGAGLRDAVPRLPPSGLMLGASEAIQRWAPPTG